MMGLAKDYCPIPEAEEILGVDGHVTMATWWQPYILLGLIFQKYSRHENVMAASKAAFHEVHYTKFFMVSHGGTKSRIQ